MPVEFGTYENDYSKRLTAWAAHYEAKGCTHSKARSVAYNGGSQ